MNPSTLAGSFFLDTNIILSEILHEYNPRIEKLKHDSELHKIPCYISDSVKKETYDKVEETCNFLGTIVREAIKYSLEESRNKRKVSLDSPMTSEDLKALEESFSLLHGSAQATKISLESPIALVEEWAITFLGEKLDKGEPINALQFLIELSKKVLTTTSSMEDPYDDIVEFERSFVKTITIVPDSSIIDALNSIGIHEPDNVHIASAFLHQAESGEKIVFCTLDYRSILGRRHLIWNQLKIKIECCDPLYALHHLV